MYASDVQTLLGIEDYQPHTKAGIELRAINLDFEKL